MSYGDADAAFMGGKTRSASFNGPAPITFEGWVTEPMEMMQQRDYYDPEKLLWWDEAETRPKMQYVVKIQTDLRDDEEDDGIRALYLKYKSQEAVRNAVKAAGAPTVEQGGWLSLTYYADEPPKPGERRKGVPPKLYRATYRRPDPAAAVAAAFDAEPVEAHPAATAANWEAGRGAPGGRDIREVAAQQSRMLEAMRASRNGGATEPPF